MICKVSNFSTLRIHYFILVLFEKLATGSDLQSSKKVSYALQLLFQKSELPEQPWTKWWLKFSFWKIFGETDLNEIQITSERELLLPFGNKKIETCLSKFALKFYSNIQLTRNTCTN